MAKQKRLNKNLIAFLTIMGMLLTISVAGLVIYQVAQRDPAKIAASAKALEDTGKPGDLTEALRLYMQAYRASGDRDTKYLIDVARCSFSLGGFGDWLSTLRQFMAKEPANPQPLLALLEGLWRLREIDPTGLFYTDGRDAAIRLLDLHLAGTIKLAPEEEVLALTSRANCLWPLEESVGVEQADGLQSVLIDPAQIERFVQAYGHTGDEAAEKAWTLAPTDPHAALTHVASLRRGAEARERDFIKAGEKQKTRENTRAYHEAALAALEPAVKANPGHVALVVAYGMALADRARDALVPAEGKIDREAAQPYLAQARQTLEAALKANEHEAQFPLALARACVSEAMTIAPQGTDITSEQREAQQKLLREAVALCAKATELEPALYDAYLLQASLVLTPTGAQTDQADSLTRVNAALEIYSKAQGDTLLLKSVRAVLTEGQRLLLLSRAFTLALQASDIARQTGHADQAPAYEKQAADFLADAAVRWPNHVITDYMQGNMALARRNPQEAIKCLERATKQDWEAGRWMNMVRVPQLPAQQLAVLYARDNQLGVAAEWADRALVQYERDLQEPAPAELVSLRAQLYAQDVDPKVGAQKAKDFLAMHEASFVTQGERDRLAGLRADLFRALGQTEQATEQVKKLVGNNQNDPTMLLWEVDQAQQNDDYDLIDRNTTAVITDPNANLQQVQLAVQMQMNALQRSGQVEEAQKRVAALLAAPPKPELVPFLKVVQTLLSTKDPQEQTALLEQQIQSESDPQVRNRRLIAFYRGMGRYEDVARLLEEQKRTSPDDLAVVEQLFDAYVRLQRYGEAETLIPLLGKADDGRGVDGVHGATFRGRLALAKSDGAAAVREFRTAVNELPQSAQLQTALARAYLLNGRLTDAEEALRHAVEINWRSPDALGMLTSVRLTLADQDFTRAEEWRRLAREVFDNLKRVAPNHPAVALLDARFSEEDDPAGAIKTRVARRQSDPNDLDNTLRLAELYGRIWDLSAGKNPGDPGALTEAQRTQLRDEGGAYFEGLLEQPTPEMQALYAKERSSLFLDIAQLATTFFHKSGQRDRGEALLNRLRDARSGREQVLLQVLSAKLCEAEQDIAKADDLYKDAQQRAMQIADAEEQKNTEALVGVAVIEYQERQRKLREMIETARWVLDRLGPEHPDARQIQRKLIEALLIMAQAKPSADAFADIERQLKIAGGIKPDDTKKLTDTALVSLFPKFDVALLSSAAKLALLKDDEATLSEALREILKQDDRNVWALMTRGMVALNRGRYDDARQDLEKAEQFTTERSDWAYSLRTVLAQLYENTNMLDKAVQQLRLKLDLLVDATNPPPDAEEREQDVTASIVRLYERQNRLDDAQALISEYLERFPSASRWPLRLGRMLDTRGDDARRARSARDAERFYRAAEQRYRDAADKALAEWKRGTTQRAQGAAAIAMSQAVAARMDVLVKLGDPAAALRCFAEPPLAGTALAQQPPPTLRLAKGRALWAAGQQAEARQEWKQTLSETANQQERIAVPGLATIVSRLSEVLSTEQLEALLREAVSETPLENDAGRRIRLALADFLMQTLATGAEAPNQQRAAEVVELTKTVAAQVPPGGVTYLWAVVTQAQTTERVGDDATAISTYEEALKSDPNNNLALNNLAYLLVSTKNPKLQRPQEAAAYADQLDQLIRSDANLPNLLDTIGWVYFQYVQMGDAGRFQMDPGDRQRRLDGAVAKLERALALSGGRAPAILEHVGQLYAFQGRNYEAQQMYRQGLEAAQRTNDTAAAARLRSLLGG